MGMFDYIRCEVSLPETPTAPRCNMFQTKDTPDQYMTVYTIKADGGLYRRPYHMEEVPKAERPYPDGEGIWELVGYIRRVEGEEERFPFHGDIRFYEYDEGYWWEYRARFTEGTMSSLTLIEYREPTPAKGAGHTQIEP